MIYTKRYSTFLAFLAALLLFSAPTYSAECQRSDGQTAVARAAQLTGSKEAITADQQAEILSCLTLAAQITETTIEGLRAGSLPFKAIRYEAQPTQDDER
ncbi:hypothetical protein ACRC7T_17410 (plasmid) [Segnochrobactraceae bacterium EtOH-i3]